MTIELNNLKSPKEKMKPKKRVGRGNASGKGTYSSRGLKGQRSRSGGKKGLKLKGFKTTLLAFPKFKGDKPKAKNQIVDFKLLNKIGKDNMEISPVVLEAMGVINSVRKPVKILNNGELKVKLTFVDCKVSKSAQEAIEKIGGKVVVKEKNIEKEVEENK